MDQPATIDWTKRRNDLIRDNLLAMRVLVSKTVYFLAGNKHKFCATVWVGLGSKWVKVRLGLGSIASRKSDPFTSLVYTGLSLSVEHHVDRKQVDYGVH